MKLTDNVYYKRLDFDLHFPDGSRYPRMTYAVLLKYNQVCLIDSGVLSTLRDVYDLLSEADVDIQDVDYLINTHCHFDHTGGNYDLKEANPGLKIMAHPEGKAFLEDPDAQYAVRPIPSYKLLIKQGVKADLLINEGDIFDIGTKLVILHTPGHSEDSISIYLPEEKLVVCGDAIPLTGDLPIYDNLAGLKRSLHKIIDLDYRYLITYFEGLYDKFEDSENSKNPIGKALNYLQLIDDHLRGIMLGAKLPLSLEEVTHKLVEKMNLPPKFPKFVYTSVSEHLKGLDLKTSSES